jgi:hypothetical protein
MFCVSGIVIEPLDSFELLLVDRIGANRTAGPFVIGRVKIVQDARETEYLKRVSTRCLHIPDLY